MLGESDGPDLEDDYFSPWTLPGVWICYSQITAGICQRLMRKLLQTDQSTNVNQMSPKNQKQDEYEPGIRPV